MPAALLAVIGLALGLVAGCGEGQASRPDAPLVFAAASLTDALDAVADAYAADGGARPRISYASSAALARQIEAGAPAALFASADEAWMDYLAARGLIEPASRVSLLGNRLVLVVPAREARVIEIRAGVDLAAWLGERPLAMADPDSVPAGRYGRAALESLDAWRAVERRVLRAENVRAALAYVERGEAAAGIVYATDANASDRVAVAGEFPSGSHPPISYPVALIAGEATPSARAFFDFLRSPRAAELFRARGFIVPEEAS